MACHIDSYLFPGVCITWGPSNDSPQLPESVRQAAENIAFDRLMAHAAYDGEDNHRLCREELGIRSTVIPLNPDSSPSLLTKAETFRITSLE